MANLVGKTLGKYKLTERLGSGGMAEVYKAHHPKLDRVVTIKVLHSYLAEGEDFLARFEREARAVASLRHPHIVQIHDFDKEDDLYYMVMEFIDQGTLQNRMLELAKSGAYMPVDQVVSILQQVGEALDYAHKQGIIHRDIKPSNILLNSSGNAFLADFGIARMMSGTQFTATGSLIGTPTYMSPEQGRGDEITPISDIYSLGVILFELLTGKVPFTSETTPLAIIHKHIHEPPPKPRALRPDLPEAAEQVVLKALAKDPKERYQSAGEMARALDKALSPEIITQLDSSLVQGSAPISTLPTMLVEAEQPEVARAFLPTMAMSEETQAEISDATPVSAEPSSLEAKKEARSPGKAPSSLSQGRKGISRRTLWIAGGVLLLVILAIVAVSLFGGKNASSIEKYVTLANEAGNRGDMQAKADYLLKAIDQVPVNQRPAYAFLWCDRGDAGAKLRQFDLAISSYRSCMDWTGNDPALQPMRDRAQAGINSLNSP